MPTTKTVRTPEQVMAREQQVMTRAQELARKAVDEWFAEVAGDIPSDGSDVNLIDHVCDIQAAILKKYDNPDYDAREHSALQAGYLLGIEIGRRMPGGVR